MSQVGFGCCHLRSIVFGVGTSTFEFPMERSDQLVSTHLTDSICILLHSVVRTCGLDSVAGKAWRMGGKKVRNVLGPGLSRSGPCVQDGCVKDDCQRWNMWTGPFEVNYCNKPSLGSTT